MPGTGATPDHRYSFGPAWAAYRLPFAGATGIVTSRSVGIAFDGEPSGDGNPPAGGSGQPAPSNQPPPAAPAAGDEGLGEAGRRALEAERAARRDAEKKASDAAKELETLRAANQSDADKALDAARKETAAQVRTEFEGRLRQSGVRSALRAAGLTNEKALSLAVNAPEFAALKVEENGSVADLDKTVESFKKDYPEMFAQPKPSGQPTRGAQGGAPADRPTTLTDAVAGHYSSATP